MSTLIFCGFCIFCNYCHMWIIMASKILIVDWPLAWSLSQTLALLVHLVIFLLCHESVFTTNGHFYKLSVVQINKVALTSTCYLDNDQAHLSTSRRWLVWEWRKMLGKKWWAKHLDEKERNSCNFHLPLPDTIYKSQGESFYSYGNVISLRGASVLQLRLRQLSQN